MRSWAQIAKPPQKPRTQGSTIVFVRQRKCDRGKVGESIIGSPFQHFPNKPGDNSQAIMKARMHTIISSHFWPCVLESFYPPKKLETRLHGYPSASVVPKLETSGGKLWLNTEATKFSGGFWGERKGGYYCKLHLYHFKTSAGSQSKEPSFGVFCFFCKRKLTIGFYPPVAWAKENSLLPILISEPPWRSLDPKRIGS